MADPIPAADDKDKLAGKILERLHDRRQEYATKHEEWERNQKKKKGLIESPYPYRNKLSIRYVKATLGVLGPQYTGSLIGDVGFDFFDMVPEEPQDEKQTRLNKQMMVKQVESVRILVAKTNTWTDDTLTYGPGYVMCPWKTRTLSVRRTVKQEANPVVRVFNLVRLREKPSVDYVKKRKRVILHRGPDMVNWSVFNFFESDITKLDLQEQDFIFASFVTNLAKLREMQKSPPPGVRVVNLEKVKDMGPFDSDDEEDAKRRVLETVGGFEQRRPLVQREDDLLFPVKIHAYFSIPEDRWMYITHSGVSILRAEDRNETSAHLPYDHGEYPFAKMVNRPTSGNGLGESEVDIIADLADAIDLSVNAREDWKATAAHPMWALEAGAGFKLKEVLRSEPGKILRCNDKEGLRLIESKLDLSGIADEDRMIRHIQVLTGAVDILRGITRQGTPETATIGSALAQSALNRFKVQVRINEAMGLKDWLSLAWKLNMEFMTQDQVIRIVGEKGAEWLRVPRDNFLINHDFKLLAGSETFHTEIEKQQLISVMQILKDDPTLNREEFKIRLFRLFKIPNPEALVNNPKMRDPNVENMMLLQGQQVEARPEDNHAAHIASHAAFRQSAERMVPEAIPFVDDHMKQHAMLQATVAAQLGRGAPQAGATPGVAGAERAVNDFTAQGTANRGPGSQALAGGENAQIPA